VAGASRPFRLDIPPGVAQVIRHLPPDLKRGVRAALAALRINPEAGSPLSRELVGRWRYRVRRYRIVYEVDARKRTLRVVAVGHRRYIYEQLAARLRLPPKP
jgi:mRNA interferase RelE/StbE